MNNISYPINNKRHYNGLNYWLSERNFDRENFMDDLLQQGETVYKAEKRDEVDLP